MITIEWKYENHVHRSVDYDKTYVNGQVVDLGWDYFGLTVHAWISALNKIAVLINKNSGVWPDVIHMNQHTFNLLYIEHCDYYDADSKKLGSYIVNIQDIDNNEVLLLNGHVMLGMIQIKL